MRGYRLTGVIVLLVAAGGGCFGSGTNDEPIPLPRPGQGVPDTVEVSLVFISHPSPRAAARFESRYWKHADEEVLAPDLRALWRGNGLRVGVAKLNVADVRARGGSENGVRHLSIRVSGARVGRRVVRIPHRGEAVLATSRTTSLATFLLMQPGRRTVVRSLRGASVGLCAAVRIVDEKTTYMTLWPLILQPGRDPADAGALDYLATEMALAPGEAILVGVGSPLKHTAGRALLSSSGRDPNMERLMLISATPVHIRARTDEGATP